jgi:two-component system, LuxR family, response regulator FixJ
MPLSKCHSLFGMQTAISPPTRGTVPVRPLLIDVVDDDPDVLGSIRFLLETEGFEVRTFRSGAAVLGSPATRRADCLVIDYKMDHMDGLAVTARLRARGVTAPIIVITGYPDDTIAERAAAAGAWCVLRKPHLDELLPLRIREAVSHDPSPAV